MVVYTEIAVPATGFRIGEAFSELPDVSVEMDRVVPTLDAVVPYIWVEGAPMDDVVRATYDHEAVEEITILHEEGDRTLYRVVWNRMFRDVIVSLAELDLVLLSGTGTAEEWRFELRSETKAPFSDFVTELGDADVPFTVVRLTEHRSARHREDDLLTEPQFEALLLAYTEGYFEEPRAVTLDSLATRLGITRQALAGRLRRAIETLAADELGNAVDRRFGP